MRRNLLPPRLALLCAMLAASVHAQEPLNPPVPLVRDGPAVASAGASAVALAAAQRAQELGLASIAEGLYRQQLAPSTGSGQAAPGVDRAALTLALATVLLDEGKPAEAEQALGGLVGLHGAAWHLRAGLAAAQLKKTDGAKTELAAAKFDELGATDRAWHFFLQGLVAEASAVPAERARAGEFYKQAADTATTELGRARFQLAEERAWLTRFGTVDEAQLRQAQATYDRFRSSPVGYDSARIVAVMLEKLGRHDEAVRALQRALLALPREEREWADSFRLTLGLIADPARELAGRTALLQLLETGVNRDKQRMALQLLASAAQVDPMRGIFRAELNKLIAATPAHPVLESLLLFRAQAALADKNSEGYKQAEDDARELRDKFPGSPLRMQAFGVLTASAWEQRRYRTAADNARKARAELATATKPEELAARAKLGVLEAEAWFRAGDTAGDAGDFRNAADAYAAALRERPADVKEGELMFQRVLAEIRAGAPETAEPLLDEFAHNPALQSASDLENRWQAEWNLARALQIKNEAGVKLAYARINRLLAPGVPAALPAELRARLLWLQARLSFEAGQPKETLRLVGDFDKIPGEIDAALKKEIASTGALLAAQAHFQLGDEAAALKALLKVRTDPETAKSDAAVYSYIVEANHYAAQDKAVDAQKLLMKLADEFENNIYAPYALFQAALQSERLGQDKNYTDANAIIERLVKRYPQSDLIFAARFKQGDLLRKLNYFPQAQQVYEELVNNDKFSHHGDAIYAKLALAECVNAQASGNPVLLADAQAKFEELRDRVDAPVDVRVEAGYNLGALLARRGDTKKALEVWWRDVAHAFLVGDKAAAAKLLDEKSTARYWMTRTLLEAGALFEKQENLEEAKAAWRLIISAKLPGESLAQARLKRFELPEVKP